MRRHDILWARIDPVEGSEMAKTRPCVIVSQDVLNAALPTVVVCPLTSVIRPRWQTRLTVRVAGRKADICADQIRTISKTRLAGKLGALSVQEGEALRLLLTELYGR